MTGTTATTTIAGDATAGPRTSRPRWLRETGYLLAGLPLGIAAFAVAVAGFGLGVGTLVVWVGLPVLVATLRACRGLAVVERRATEAATGHELPPHHYRVRPRVGDSPPVWSPSWPTPSRGGTSCTPSSGSRSGSPPR